MISPRFLVRITDFVFVIIELIIGLRIILKLFGANPAASFVRWVYETSAPLLSPFQGMFPSPQLQGGFVLEFAALFGLIIYALVGHLLIEAFKEIIYQIAEGKKTREQA